MVTNSQLYVSTRKGLFELTRTNGTYQVSDIHFLGDPVTFTLATDDTLYAALNLGHFGIKFRRKDGDTDWQEFDPPSLEHAKVGSDEEKAPSVMQIWSVVQGSDENELWAGTIPAALFHSKDRGQTWQLNEALWNEPSRTEWFGGGYDQAGIHSILIHPHDPADILLGISCGGVWHTNDKGSSWHHRCQGLRAEYMPPEKAGDPVSQDPHQIAQCQTDPEHLWMQHHNGIFHSTDRAQNWRELTDIDPSTFGFAVVAHPNDAKTAWFVPAVKDECRVPSNGKVIVNRTQNSGQSFQTLKDGLPQNHAYDLTYRHAMTMDEQAQTLAFGTTSGGLWWSDNNGDDWQSIDARLPPIYALSFRNRNGR